VQLHGLGSHFLHLLRSDAAKLLCTRHHSAVQLIDRTEQLGLITRNREDSKDRRVVRLALTRAGQEKLALLGTIHLEELHRLASLVGTFVEPAPAQQ
jgi:DNA-binding MarR family transcriptional regulator